jgi:hypothetical protein
MNDEFDLFGYIMIGFFFYRCASGIKEVTDVCLSGLIALLSNADGSYVNIFTLFIEDLQL